MLTLRPLVHCSPSSSSTFIKSLCQRCTELVPPLSSTLNPRSSARPFSLGAVWREVIGIDFGTSNCRAAVMEKDGNPKMVELSDRKTCMPAVVSFDNDGKAIVGAPPKHIVPEKTVSAIKRLVGHSYNSMELQSVKNSVSYDIIPPDSEDEEEDEDCEARIRLSDGKIYSPTYIASLIIGKLIDETAKSRGNTYASHAVIAVPPSFNDARTFALRAAAERYAPCASVIDESLAASLYHATKNSREGHFAVIDLGGGSFDVSIVNVSEGRAGLDARRIATVHGGSFAGLDVDWAVMESAMRRLNLDGPISSSLIRREAERAKIEFCSSPACRSRMELNLIRDRVEIWLERSEFEAAERGLLLKIGELCRRCLETAAMGPRDVDEVILLGGMSRAPRVWELVEDVFAKKPSEEVDPDEAVAFGAAIKANLIANKNENLFCF